MLLDIKKKEREKETWYLIWQLTDSIGGISDISLGHIFVSNIIMGNGKLDYISFLETQLIDYVGQVRIYIKLLS